MIDCLLCKSSANQKKLFSSKDLLTKLPGTFNLFQCKKCGLVFQNPRPKRRFIHLYYPDSLGYFTVQSKKSSIFRNIEIEVLVNYYGYSMLGKKNVLKMIVYFPFYFYLYRSQSIPKYRENGKLLDIGCSNGIKLEGLKGFGWETKGIEPNENAAKLAISKGLDVKIGSIQDIEFPKKYFDVIILDMVLEHLYNPDEALKKISSWLKKDGQLIFSIPYFEGIEFRIFKEYSYGLQLPTHMTFFNKKNIQSLLERDFSKIEYRFQHFDRDVVASAQYKYDATKNILYRFIANNKPFRFLIIKPLIFIFSLLRKTSRVTVFAIKK